MSPETIPILPSADFDVSASFWSVFGFVERGRWLEYLILRHPGLEIELHFWISPKVDRWTNDVSCYIRFDHPEEVLGHHASWADVAVAEPALLTAPEVDDSGAVEFQIIDPHGNLVRLGGFPHSPAS